MKIRVVDSELQPKTIALLRQAFPGRSDEIRLVEKLRSNRRDIHEWVCIHTGKVIAHIVFTNAYNGKEVCGLHLAPLAVKPEFQRQGVGSELLHFALRQEAVRSSTLFVHGDPLYYRKFGFESCRQPLCPFDMDNKHFLSIRNDGTGEFVVAYEPEFGEVD